MVSDWTIVEDVVHVSKDEHTRKKKKKRAKSQEHRVLLVDFAFFFNEKDTRSGESIGPAELIVPAFSRITLYRKGTAKSLYEVSYSERPRLDTWKPDEVLEKIQEERDEVPDREHAFSRTDLDRTFICFIQFTVGTVDHLITVFDDCVVRYRRREVRRRVMA